MKLYLVRARDSESVAGGIIIGAYETRRGADLERGRHEPCPLSIKAIPCIVLGAYICD